TRDRGAARTPAPRTLTAAEALTYAADRNFEREAVVDERMLLRDALTRSMGDLPVAAITDELDRRIEAGEVLPVTPPPGPAARAFTTPAMIALEHETLAWMRAGQHTQPALASEEVRHAVDRGHLMLNDPQRAAVQQILANEDRVQALDGVAGAGKTTTLRAIQ